MYKIKLKEIKDSDFTLIVQSEGKEIGHLVFTVNVFDNKTAIITDLEVRPKYQRRGIGKALVEEAIRRIKKFTNIKRILIEDGSGTGATSQIALKLGFNLDSAKSRGLVLPL